MFQPQRYCALQYFNFLRKPAVGLGYVLAVLLLPILWAGCVQDRPLQVVLHDDVDRPARSVVIFLVDGMDRTRFRELLSQGRLPNIEKQFIDGGVRVSNAVASLPSVTYPNCSTLITGQFPGHHGILGNVWFDRTTLICRDYRTYKTYRTVNQHLTVPTLFDLLGDHFTLNIQAHTRRGVTHTIDNQDLFAWSWVFGRHIDADRYVGVCLEEAAQVANRMKRWPTVLMTYYPGVDEIGHRTGPDSPEYTDALLNIDGVVGRMCDALDEAGLGESTYYVLVTDHSMPPISRQGRFDLLQWLQQEKGMRLRTTSINAADYVDRHALLDPYDGVAVVDAGRVGMIHLQGGRGWAYRPDPGEVDQWVTDAPSLMTLTAIEFAMMRAGPDRVRVRSRDGVAIVERRVDDTTKRYRLAPQVSDILGYRATPKLAAFVDQGWHTSCQWLNTTIHTRYPDFVPQVVEMFDSSRTGDVVLMAAKGWSFVTNENGGHGSCTARDMLIPMLFAGPDIPHGGELPVARLVDVMPTVLGLLNEQQRLERITPIDGTNLAAKIKQAQPKTQQPKTGHRTKPRPIPQTATP